MIKLIVFKPKSIPKHSFYLDYPKVKRSLIIFISSHEDLPKLGITRHAKLSSYITYTGLPFREARDIIYQLKQNGLRVFNYDSDIMFTDKDAYVGDDNYAKAAREADKIYTENI